MVNTNKLEGKVAIITGGASGIGEASARLFAENGTRTIIIADIQDELGQQVAESIGSQKCEYKHCDVTDEDQVKALVESTVQNHGKLDILFSNVGIGSRNEYYEGHQSILDLDLSAFDRLFAINVRGMAACVKHAARVMVEGRVRGSIVCTGSTRGIKPGKFGTDYHMSKNAVMGLVRSAGLQLGEHGIRVNCVSPHGVATPLTCHVFGTSPEEVEKMYEAQMILKGEVLKKKHVADAVLFLASSDSELITGHNLVVDGGFLIG